MAETRTIHVLDDNNNPAGPVLCGKTSTQVLGEEFEKGDRLCRRCAIALLARNNEYADLIDDLRSYQVDAMERLRVQRRKLEKKDRMLGQLLERYLDEEDLGK